MPLPEREAEFLRNLPHIIDAGEYVFVHSGLEDAPLEAQDAYRVMKMDDFVEPGTLSFERWVVVGHMPTNNLTQEIPCCNPIVFESRRIIAIDGSNVTNTLGQLNAFIIRNGEFSFEAVDGLPDYVAERSQSASGGSYNITWFDRFVELISDNGEFSTVRRLSNGQEIELPSDMLWRDGQNRLCVVSATDYPLPVEAGETVKLIKRYSDRIWAKKDGICGWIYL